MDLHCVGHEDFGCLEVTTSFPDGTQTEAHPRPGERYRGTIRVGFYPDDEVGKSCVRLLVAAFERGVLFRIGTSATTGAENSVCYAVHQKSRVDGGTSHHGWPDPTYLDRLRSECATRGIFLEQLPVLVGLGTSLV